MENKKQSAMTELFSILDNYGTIMPDTRQWLLEMEKLQTIEAYNLDPDLMKIQFKNANEWFKNTYGR